MTTPDITSIPENQTELERRVEELAESERRFWMLINAVRQIITVALPNGSITFVNDQFLRYTGLRAEDSLGMNWLQTVHPDDLGDFTALRDTSVAAGRDYEFKIRLRRHDGAYRWHMGRTVAVVNDGKVQSWIGTATDVHDLVETERALRDSEARFKLMSEVIPQLVWIALPNGKVESFNSRWYAYTGLSPEESRGAGWEKTVHPDDLIATLTAWKKSTDLGAPFSVEQRLRRADGRYRWFLTQALPLADGSGGIARWYGTCTDIEDQKQLQDETRKTRERLEIALEAGRMGVWEYDVVNGLASWTPSLSILYGFDPAVLSGPQAFLEKFVHPDDLAHGRAVVKEAIDQKQPFRFEYRVIRPDGAVRWLEARGRVYAEPGGPVRTAGVSVDVTDRKEADRELARRAEDLARSNKELEQFAFVASHDLKEPLRKIAGYAELIQSRYQSKLDEKGERFLTYLQDGVRRMDAIIGDLLTYSRAGRGAQKREAVDLAELVKETLDDLEQSLNEAKATVTVGPLPTLSVNRTQIRQVLQNLIANALKFRGERAPEISLASERAGEFWKIAVKDNGIGIEAQYFDRIFEIFQRLHTRSEYPGTGIGLAICKKIVEAHGGRIWVESSPGQGSTFFFTIPAF